jgi:hypothetical protein
METNIYYRFIMHNPIRHSRTAHSPMCMEVDLAALVALVALVVEK